MEVSSMPQRPWKVKLAVNLLYLSLVLGTIRGFLDGTMLVIFGVWLLLYCAIANGHKWVLFPVALSLYGLPGSFIIVMAVTGICFGLYYMIGKGKDWARMIVLAVFFTFAVFIVFMLITRHLIEASLPLLVVQESSIRAVWSVEFGIAAILQITALKLLFQRDSSDWFKAMKISKIQGEEFERKPAEREPGEALMGAARTGNTKQVQNLLGKGASVNSANEWGLTPLMAAAQSGHLQTGRVLLEKGADVNAKQKSGWTALMVAAFKGHADFVEFLLGKAVDVNAQTERGVTALMLARSNGSAKIAELLETHGATE